MHVSARANLYVLKFPPCFCRGEKTIHYLAQVLGQVMDLLRLAERQLVVVELHFFFVFLEVIRQRVLGGDETVLGKVRIFPTAIHTQEISMR